MSELHVSWGEKVRERRLELSLTQVQLADLSGLTQGFISAIEKGSTQLSDASKYKLAAALAQTVENLFPYPAMRPPMRRRKQNVA